MFPIANSLQGVKTRIDAAIARRPARFTAPVRLLAVSKNKTATEIAAAIEIGIEEFGENYVQEALPKIAVLAPMTTTRCVAWHLIGPLQSNKAKLVAQHFDWVQSINREKIADALDRHRSELQRPLDVLVQVNASAEPAKSGIAPDGVLALARHVAAKPRLRLRGLMTIAENVVDESVLRSQFRLVRDLFEELAIEMPAVDTLSMGMSADFPIAIEEGATLVRIGTAIFGERV